MQLPRRPSGMISESLVANSVRLVLLTSIECISDSDCSRIAATTRGWQRPTQLTPTPAERSMKVLPSGSLKVTPKARSMTTGMRPPPRAIDSVRSDCASAAAAFGPGYSAVTIFGASAKFKASSSVSITTDLVDGLAIGAAMLDACEARPVARIGRRFAEAGALQHAPQHVGLPVPVEEAV